MTTTTFRQDFPFTGQAASVALSTDFAHPANLGQTATQYLCRDFVNAPAAQCSLAPGKRYFVHPSVIDKTGDRDVTEAGQPSTAMPGSHSELTLNAWGDVTRQVDRILRSDGSNSGHLSSPPTTCTHR